MGTYLYAAHTESASTVRRPPRSAVYIAAAVVPIWRESGVVAGRVSRLLPPQISAWHVKHKRTDIKISNAHVCMHSPDVHKGER